MHDMYNMTDLEMTLTLYCCFSAMGRVTCCLMVCLLIYLMVTTNINTKANKQDKNLKKLNQDEMKPEQTRKIKDEVGEKKIAKDEVGKKKKKKKKRTKDEVVKKDWTSSFNPNWMCNERQARNYCYGSGFAGMM